MLVGPVMSSWRNHDLVGELTNQLHREAIVLGPSGCPRTTGIAHAPACDGLNPESAVRAHTYAGAPGPSGQVAARSDRRARRRLRRVPVYAEAASAVAQSGERPVPGRRATIERRDPRTERRSA